VRAAGNPDVEAGGLTALSTKKAEAISLMFHTLPSLGAEDVQRWVKYWVEKGFLAA
jgi:hypothetical protein